MATEREQLRQTLDQLHQQLQGAKDLDPQLAAQLRTTTAEIEQKLSAIGSAPPAAAVEQAEPQEEESFQDSLQQAAVHFEESHPTLYGTVSRLIDVLAQLGI